MRRLLVNDCLSALPGHRTFWNDLQDWFGMEFCGGDYSTLTADAEKLIERGAGTDLVIRNASYFPPIKSDVPQIALLQDIFTEGPLRDMQIEVILNSKRIVFNSAFTESHYDQVGIITELLRTNKKELQFSDYAAYSVIPLPVDFSIFTPGNTMGLQQALSLPDGCVCWVGACQGAAGQVKGWDIFLQIVRLNPDIPFVAVFKDAAPETILPNLRVYVRLSQEDLAKVMGACRVGLCTSRMESQHLAGIEMGACGLPLVVPPVGTYWHRDDIPGYIVRDGNFVSAVRGVVQGSDAHRGRNGGFPKEPAAIRAYWRKEFDREVIRGQWEKLIEEVEGDSTRTNS